VAKRLTQAEDPMLSHTVMDSIESIDACNRQLKLLCSRQHASLGGKSYGLLRLKVVVLIEVRCSEIPRTYYRSELGAALSQAALLILLKGAEAGKVWFERKYVFRVKTNLL
jgi:hypothetical protein